MISVYFQGKPSNITVIQVYAPSKKAKEAEVEYFYEDLQDHLQLTPKKKKNVLFITGYWNAKIGSQEIPAVIGKFDLRVQNEIGQRLIGFAKRMHWSKKTPFSNNTREDFTHGHNQMINTKIRLIIFFAAEDGDL